MTESAMSGSSKPCICTDESTSDETLLSPHCECPRDNLGIVIHDPTCLMFKSEKISYPQDPTCQCEYPQFEDGVCLCCSCPVNQCRCHKAGRGALDEWRAKRDVGSLPAVLESTHPLMQKFQESLKQFLLKENAIAEEEIFNLREELKMNKQAYDKDLEIIYRSDHDTNAQRVLIEEYEATLAQRTMEREAAENRAREANEKHKKAMAMLDEDIIRERETTQEMEALAALCNQLETWRNETDSDLTVSQRMSDKMRMEKKVLADEKRQLDMFLFGLSNEVWKLESKLEMFKKQFDVKNAEMDKINDKVTAYSTELEDLELEKRRLVSLWNSVIVNIKQRDKVYNSVKDDYKTLQESYSTLVNTLAVTKKIVMEEMNKGKEISMNMDKLKYEIGQATKLHDEEDAKRQDFETRMQQLNEAIEMTERDHELLKSENATIGNFLKSTCKELNRKNDLKIKLENEILLNLQECLLNDKSVEAMANGIRKMREMSRKQEISLMTMENNHTQVIFEIEVFRQRQVNNNRVLEESLALVKEKEKEINEMQIKEQQTVLKMTKKQRELDTLMKKYTVLKELFDSKSPQERRIDQLEKNIKVLRERTETLQHEWLRQQGHVVKLADHHHLMVTEINLITKQIQICNQKIVRIQSELEAIERERNNVERSLRTWRGRLQVLERTRKDATERNEFSQRANLAITHEYAANLKDAEIEIIQLEEDIAELDKDKMNLTQELDRVQREALIWQRKGMLAVDLKKNVKNTKSAAGEIGQMKNEIHKMEVRREQLRRMSEKLAEDLSLYVNRRDNAMDKARAAAAMEKASGTNTAQTTYHHKLRLARADLARVTKDIADAKAQLEKLRKEQDSLDQEIEKVNAKNSQLEENIADLIRQTRITDRNKQWLLERVVRTQRFGNELTTAVKRQSLRGKKPKDAVLAEYNRSKAMNDRLQYVVGVLKKEYPHLEDKLDIIANTLNVTPESPFDKVLLDEEEKCPLVKDGEFQLDEEIINAAREEMAVLSVDPETPEGPE